MKTILLLLFITPLACLGDTYRYYVLQYDAQRHDLDQYAPKELIALTSKDSVSLYAYAEVQLGPSRKGTSSSMDSFSYTEEWTDTGLSKRVTTRDLGTKFTVSSVGDDVKYHFIDTRLKKWHPLNLEVGMMQPIFETMEVEAQLTLPKSGYTILGGATADGIRTIYILEKR
jgi:hypothetical protein